MNVIFSTQSDSLSLFHALSLRLSRQLGGGARGFTLSDSWHYSNWTKRNQDFEREGYFLLPEWELTDRKILVGEPDFGLINQYERELGGPGLFGAIVSDRRILFGPNCTYSQDYRRRFTDDELLLLLQHSLVRVDGMFASVKPHLVVTFICVTILDYLVYLFAKARGIRFLNLRTSRISNYVNFSSTLNDPSPELLASLENCKRDSYVVSDPVTSYIAKFREGLNKYEGVVAPSASPAQKVTFRLPRIPISAARFLKIWWKYRASLAATDNHCPGLVKPLVYKGIVNRFRAKIVKLFLKPHYGTPSTQLRQRFAFFPLHTEPEVSLLVYSRPLINQIEIVRSVALSLPADMFLVVKEHPWMVGKRKLSFYLKLLNIPKVILSPPETAARTWVESSSLIITIASSVALEAVMLKRPVVTFGHVPMNALSEKMVRRCQDLTNLPQILRSAINDHDHDELELSRYVSAVMNYSVPVNLYTVLLGRTNGFSGESSTFDEDIQVLAEYLIGIIKTVPPKAPNGPDW